MQKAKITPAPANLTRDLTGKNIGCWFVVAYMGQRDGVHYWRCMSRASWADFPAEKIIAEGEILDPKLNAISNGFHLREEPWRNPIGWIFGEWTVLGLANTFVGQFGKQEQFWKCRCICGTEREVSKDDLITARTPCCGCRSESEIREVLRSRQRLAKEGWYQAIGAVHRRIQEGRHDKKWTPKMERALRRFQPACVICGATDDLTTHHIHPLCRGHGREPGNVVRLCRSCNSSIGMTEPRNLRPDMARKLETGAAQFREHWESGCNYPATSTAFPVEEAPKSLDPALITILRALECGDDSAIPTLADWLEQVNDPRASAIREVTRWKAVVQSTRTRATEVRHSMEFLSDGKRCGPSVIVTRSPGDTEDSIAKRLHEARQRVLSDEVWDRLGLKRDLIHTLKQYLGINSTGHRATPEEIAQQWRKRVQTIQSRINRALYLLNCSEAVVVRPRYVTYFG